MNESSSIRKQTINSSTRDRIFTTAVDLFSKKGFHGVSIREITREVGINESSFYNHFKSKDGLLQEIFKRFQEESNKSRVSEVMIDEFLDKLGPYEFLKASLDIFMKTMGDPEINKIGNILTIEQFGNDTVRDIFEQEIIIKPRQLYTEVFSKMIKNNFIKPLDPKVLAEEYLSYSISLFYEFAVLKHGNFDVQDIPKRVTRHIDFFWDRIKI